MTNQSLEEMKKIIRETTIQLMDYGGTVPEATREVVADVHPELWAALGDDQLLTLCREIQGSTHLEESARFQKLFGVFNARYFEGKLDGFTVLAA